MLDTELTKTMKKTPIVEHDIPKRIFVANGGETLQSENIITQLWGFEP